MLNYLFGSPIYTSFAEGVTLNNTIQYNTIQYNTIQNNTIQHNTPCVEHQNNTIQYNTIQYNTIQYNTGVLYSRKIHVMLMTLGCALGQSALHFCCSTPGQGITNTYNSPLSQTKLLYGHTILMKAFHKHRENSNHVKLHMYVCTPQTHLLISGIHTYADQNTHYGIALSVKGCNLQLVASPWSECLAV